MVLKEESGAKLGKFYSNGKEVKWDMMVETKKIFEKERVDEENNEEDVVIEKETLMRNNDVEDKAVGEVKPLKKQELSKSFKLVFTIMYMEQLMFIKQTLNGS